jgi:hypothetical protein
MSGYTKDQVSTIVQGMSPEEYQNTLAQLKQAAPGEFNYSVANGISDYWKDNALGTRLAGTVQWLAGGLQAAGALLSTPVACATGVGCGTAGYLWIGGWDSANAGAYAMVNGQYTYTGGGQLLQYAGLSPGAAELTYGLTQLSPAAYEAYAANKSVNAWVSANQAAKLSYTTEPFLTQGLQITPEVMQSPVAQAMINQYIAAGLSESRAMDYTAGLLQSGKQLPVEVIAGPDTELIKLVPRNASGSDSITGYSPFFMTKDEYSQIAGMSASEIADYFGLPAEQGIRGTQLGFDVYSMTPKPGTSPTIFSSEVAPVQQGRYSASGGARQVLTPNRNEWTDPNTNKIGQIGGGK